jgi:hypothetical protein
MKRTLLLALGLIASGCGPPDGPFERYYENGKLEAKGTANVGEECGEWIGHLRPPVLPAVTSALRGTQLLPNHLGYALANRDNPCQWQKPVRKAAVAKPPC